MPNKFSILVVDTETTGLDPAKNNLIEFAAILLNPDLTEKARFDSGVMNLVRPGGVEQSAMDVNKIPMEHVLTGYNPADKAYEFIAWLDEQMGNAINSESLGLKFNRVLFAGHNAKFDWGFMGQWFEDSKLPNAVDRFSHRIIDSQTIAWAELVFNGRFESASLSNCKEHYGITAVAHRAMSDAEATAELLRRLLQQK